MANPYCTLTLIRSVTLPGLIADLGLTPDVFYSLGCNSDYYGIGLPIAAGNVVTIPCGLDSVASGLGIVSPMTIGNPCLATPNSNQGLTGYQGPGTVFQQPSSGYQLSNNFQAPTSSFQTSGFQAPTSSFQTPSTGLSGNFQAPTSSFQTSGFQAPTSSFQTFQTPSTGLSGNFQAPTSSFQTPSTGLSGNFQAPTSSFQTFQAPTSSFQTFQAPTSSFQAPTSSFQAPTSSFQAPTSSFQAPSSEIQASPYQQQAIADFQHFESQGFSPCQSMIDAIAELLGADVTGVTMTVGPGSLIDSNSQWILRIDSRYPMNLTQIEAKLADLGVLPIKVVPSDRTKSTSVLVYSLADVQKAFTVVSSVGNNIVPCAHTANSLQFNG